MPEGSFVAVAVIAFTAPLLRDWHPNRLELEILNADTATALVGAGLISVVIFPAVALASMGDGKSSAIRSGSVP